jgi:DNA-binding MarR family transcriptional regulator
MREKPKLGGRTRKLPVQPETARRFTATVASVHIYLDEIRSFFAKRLGITGPQVAILMTIKGLNTDGGVSVRHVARALHVDPSFITTQTKLLEKRELIRRQTDENDARVVKLSLSDKAIKQIADLTVNECSVNDVVFADFTDEELDELNGQLDEFKNRLEKTCLRLAGGF